ncbi:MAG: hypothetical protein Q9218_007990 [Villophora microphyllina]
MYQYDLPAYQLPSTLNADITGKRLAFILLFKNQHFEWIDKGWINCKSNLHLLAPPDGSAPEPHPDAVDMNTLTYEPDPPSHPIAVFTQDYLPNSCLTYPESESKPFQFRGWYNLGTVLYLREGSDLVMEMLRLKFGEMGEERRKRTAGQWDISLGARWTCVRLVPWVGEYEMVHPMVPLKGAMLGMSAKEKTLEEEVRKLMKDEKLRAEAAEEHWDNGEVGRENVG